MQLDIFNGFRLSVWSLEDYASGQWTSKHTARILELLGRPRLWHKEYYTLAAIHPERNMIFLNAGVVHDPEKTLMSYDMDNQKLHVICTLERYDMLKFWPYVPCFAERPSDAQ
jgi:hypothetical protein